MKAAPKREGPLKVPLPFDAAMRLAMKVKPPAEGWKAYEKALRAKQEMLPEKVRKKRRKPPVE